MAAEANSLIHLHPTGVNLISLFVRLIINRFSSRIFTKAPQQTGKVVGQVENKTKFRKKNKVIIFSRSTVALRVKIPVSSYRQISHEKIFVGNGFQHLVYDVEVVMFQKCADDITAPMTKDLTLRDVLDKAMAT